ncbi:MAG: alpha/beta hydrolase [Pseudomonadota bacterium]
MEKFEFTGSQGNQLSARLDSPEGDPKGYVLFAHCFTCTKDIFSAGRITKALNNNGFAVVRFDFTGLGSSEGDFANTNFTSNVQDLSCAVDYMRENMKSPDILVGHSLGGSAVLSAAKNIPEAKAVATIGSPADVEHVAHLFKDNHDEIMEEGEAEVCLVGRPFKIKKQFIEDIKDQKLSEDIAQMRKALMIFHAPKDDIVGIENAEAIFKAAKHPKSYISLDDADHLLSNKDDAEYVGNLIANWALHYI